MPPEAPTPPPVKLSDLLDALEFASDSVLGDQRAYIRRRTGGIILVADGVDQETEADLPDEPDEAEYQAVPSKRDLNLGGRLPLAFVAEHLPAALPKAREIFSRKGAYRRFEQLLHATGALENWYAFEAQATEAALKAWCEVVGITVID